MQTKPNHPTPAPKPDAQPVQAATSPIIDRRLEGTPTGELAHEACNYAAHNQVCPLAIAQTLRRQVERDAERMEALQRQGAGAPAPLAALESIVTQANGDLSDAEFRRYARDVIARNALAQLARGETK
jgi:hypothetical protein